MKSRAFIAGFMLILCLCGCQLGVRDQVPSITATPQGPFTTQSRAGIRPPSASAVLLPAQETLVWNASPAAEVVGYNLYYGNAPVLNNMMAVGTNLSATVTGLNYWQSYDFAVSAVDAAGNESDFSNVVAAETPAVLALSFGEFPGDTLQASADLVNWSPRAATLSNNLWQVVISRNVPWEFYRASGQPINP